MATWKPSFFAPKNNNSEKTQDSAVMTINKQLQSLLQMEASEALFQEFSQCMQTLRDMAVKHSDKEAADVYLNYYREFNGEAYDRIIQGHRFDPFDLVSQLTVKETQFTKRLEQVPALRA